MSQKDDSENDIWEYKPLEKKRKNNTSMCISRRRCPSRKTSKPSVRSQEKNTKNKSAKGEDSSPAANILSLSEESPAAEITSPKEKSTSEDYCPICQMPFCVLVVQSQRWHVAECLDTPRDKCKECPDGLQCSSTIPNHYKRFNHTLLAESRAHGGAAAQSLFWQTEISDGEHIGFLKEMKKEGTDFPVDPSQGTVPISSSFSSQGASPGQNSTIAPQSKPTNGLLLLRSPAPDDLKKKKGWLSNSKGLKSGGKTEILSTPVKETAAQTFENSSKQPSSLRDDDGISYSPLSELPAETEVNKNCRKSLFVDKESDNEHSVILFNDSFSSEDEILSAFIQNNRDEHSMLLNDPPSLAQLDPVSSLAPANHVVPVRAEPEPCRISSSSFQSPQSIVLEHLRETLLSSEGCCSQKTSSPQESSSQDSNNQSMPPTKGQGRAGQASGLKQTDIGVFFGLKPLKEKQTESGQDNLDSFAALASGKNPGRRRQRRDGQGKGISDPAAEEAQTPALGNESTSEGGRSQAGRGWRRRWNRVNADGEVQLPRCPFYKKIPGTKFAVDAFRYGEIQGITTYFLTHFHSDHYGGLTKSSTFPIYCNKPIGVLPHWQGMKTSAMALEKQLLLISLKKGCEVIAIKKSVAMTKITGNLVKSKLRVADQYIHILPMNTEVNVEGVRVILLDANHCPGAAMLLFFLPDGQTVLHTGDFRADPSMETYPELLSCRVQTLYLDTTYCSPEYTFPRQQEVINFAANTAFELVTLNPRTLVVCGSYSVGKEKVFLALAEVLGSKVSLSRDKYNTMCCLESQQIKERITTDWKAAQVHVLPMMQISFKKLQDHLSRFKAQYDRLIAFKPTGWTFSEQVESVEDIQPQISGNISIYGIPYSEHSSFLELKRFVQWLKPLKIIPTVNVGSWASRKAMEKCFNDWLSEARAKL